MMLFRNLRIKRCVQRLRDPEGGGCGPAFELQRLRAVEAVPDLFEALRTSPYDLPHLCLIQVLSEIGCPSRADELLEALFEQHAANQPYFGWEHRLPYLVAARSGTSDDFDSLVRALFKSGDQLEGVLVTCLRILSWKLHIPESILQLSIGFNTIYTRSEPGNLNCIVFTDPIDYAFSTICRHQCPMSANLLHRISMKEDIIVWPWSYIGYDPTVAPRLKFRRWRDSAAEELLKRGSPLYRPENYLLPCTCGLPYQPKRPSNADAHSLMSW